MSDIHAEVDVEVPVRTAYDLWTAFEEFPSFMGGVEEVRRVGTDRLHWVAEIAGVHREWDARIVEQRPDRVVAWRSVAGADNRGRVEFESLGPNRCRVRLEMHYEPDGLAERVGDAVGIVDRRAEADLQRFKHFVEARGAAGSGRIGGDGRTHVTGSHGTEDEAADRMPIADLETGTRLGDEPRR